MASANCVQSPVLPHRWQGYTKIALFLVSLCLLVSASLFPPQVAFDAAFGLLVLKSQQRGAPFNKLRMPSADNLATDRDVFWAAHSPAQYAVPALLSKPGLPLGLALRVIQTGCLLTGMIGYYALFRFLRFPKPICLASCLVIITNRSILQNAYVYTGGPLLLFAFYPVLVLSLVRILQRGGLLLLWLPFLIVVTAFIKLSLLLVALATCLGVALLKLHKSQLRTRSTALEFVAWILAIGVGFLVVQITYLSRGWTAAQPSAVYSAGDVIVHMIYSVGAILSSIMPIFWISLHLGFPFELSDNLATELTLLNCIILLVVGIASSVISLLVLKRLKFELYRALLASSAGVHLLLISLFFSGKSLLVEDRHFWPVGVLLLPGLLCVVVEARSKVVKVSFLVAIVFFSAYGLASFGTNLTRLASAGRSTNLVISFPGYEQAVIDRIEALDRELAGGRNVFFVLEPALGLLVRRNEVFVPTNTRAAFGRRYCGKVDRLLVVLKVDLVERVGLQRIVGCFPGMGRWYFGRIDDCVLLYAGSDVPAAVNSLMAEWEDGRM